MKNILDFNAVDLKNFFKFLGEPAYRAQQCIQWIHQQGITSFESMSNFSKKLQDKLKAHTEIRFPEKILEKKSSDGTIKWLLRLHDHNVIETVFIPEKKRGTLCVSSQVGCVLNCSFCATGKAGFNRNLSVSEIIAQVWMAKHAFQQTVTNVVMMGMGEPLLNYRAVVDAMEWMLSDWAYGLSKYRVTISTAGVVPALAQLRTDIPVSLAVSLHAPNNTLRNQLVPLNRKYPLEILIPACRSYFSKESGRSVTFEYVMLQDVNDGIAHAHELIQLLDSMRCKINLIPFNPFCGTRYRRSSDAAIENFRQILKQAGILSWVRKTRGEETASACGQLTGSLVFDRTKRSNTCTSA